MKILPESRAARAVLVMVSLLAGVLTWNMVTGMDQLFWPQSAKDRIEKMAEILRRIQAPARWCHPSYNIANLYAVDPTSQHDFGKCVASITPASDYVETGPGEYIKRFYHAELGNKFCEVTLSTVYRENRVIGSDCYFGLFPNETDTGVGMTDDKFG